MPGRYLPVWPAYVVGDDPAALTFTVEIDEKSLALSGEPAVEDQTADIRRAYATRVALHRIHQSRFRERVLKAYRECCAICRLRHRELLDATHILPDRHPKGEPLVSNGLSLCKLHHAAYDRNILGIRPDLHIEIRSDILNETDGPMLQHGLQGLQGSRLLVVPRCGEDRPDPTFLEERYKEFRQAS
ncbi:MAG: HNH endonuclease [Gemmatimonadota bacterium]